MKWRDSLPKYDTYRGSMRLLVNGAAVECINSVVMDDYLKRRGARRDAATVAGRSGQGAGGGIARLCLRPIAPRSSI